MTLSNYQILTYAQALYNLFDHDDTYIPVKANFIIQKNIRLITIAGEEVEKARLQIAAHYGTFNKEQEAYVVAPEKMEEANQELNNLFSIEQDLDIRMISLSDLGNVEFTAKQMQALMFMIED